MEISAAKVSDLEELAQLYQQLIPNDFSISKMEEVLVRQQSNPGHFISIARVDGKVVGSLLSVTCEMLFGQCKSFMVIEDVVVDESMKRKGIGSALMIDAEKRAQASDCSYIMLITDVERLGSQSFYKSLGYQTDEYCAFKKSLNPSS